MRSRKEKPRAPHHGLSQQKRQEISIPIHLVWTLIIFWVSFFFVVALTLLICLVGSLDAKELNVAMRAMGFEVTEYIDYGWFSSSSLRFLGGAIDFDEFLYMMKAKIGESCSKKLTRAFRIIDQDGDEDADAEEFMRILRSCGH
ncbi:hypothetical protein C4D60_Mb10t10910 [Musa balbisiana]|uniref:EF-hand domain-containing protein n=1 Tax=Musa balbisiana TaxID=52838 RepID=A0A4S8IXK3_MUSBA|nr:hypothetical protein C4D60_Mb10t10910 [Musa balbisiana]